MHQNSIIVGIPLNYSIFSSSQCVASCETSLPFHLHPKKETKNLWGWSTKSLIGGGNHFVTSMRRSLQDNFRGKNSQKSIKYSQSYDVVCHLALLGGKGLIQSRDFVSRYLQSQLDRSNSVQVSFLIQLSLSFRD